MPPPMIITGMSMGGAIMPKIAAMAMAAAARARPTPSRNSTGATVATIKASETDPGEHFVTWNGLDQHGTPLPADTYQLAVTAKSASGDATVQVAPLVRTTVTGVDLSGGEPLVVTRTGEFLVSAIRGVYEGATTAAGAATPQAQSDAASAAATPAATTAAAASPAEEAAATATDTTATVPGVDAAGQAVQ